MGIVHPEFADYCCELLSSVGPCTRKRMFGGWAIATGGRTIAWVIDLGDGQTLWLKADADSRARYEAAGCRRFTYTARSVNYYSAPEDAMESPALMAPWARQALACALSVQPGSAARSRRSASTPASPSKPKASRPAAPRPSTSARRKSANG